MIILGQPRNRQFDLPLVVSVSPFARCKAAYCCAVRWTTAAILLLLDLYTEASNLVLEKNYSGKILSEDLLHLVWKSAGDLCDNRRNRYKNGDFGVFVALS